MRHRAATTAVFAAALMLVVLVAPTAGAGRADIVADTVTEQLDGLPALDAAPEAGSLAFAGVEGRRSERVEAPIAFSMIGFEVPELDVPVWFRTSADGRTWTEWEGVHVHPDEGPDPDSEEYDEAWFSAPVWVRDARYVQTRVGVGASPQDVRLHLIDSSGLNRGAAERAADAVRTAWRGLVSGAPAAAQVNQPAITTRSEWGANESWRSGSPSYSAGIDFASVHHTVNSNNYTRSEAPAIVRGIYSYHTRSLGWNDIGYNFLVDRFGRIYEGRYGGMDKPVIGAHAAGFNRNSTGVALIGEYGSTQPSSDALESIARVLAWKFDLHHVDAGATTKATSAGGRTTRWPAGTEVTLNVISGHRDTSNTACPGDALYNRLGWLRNRTLELASDMFIGPEASPTLLRIDATSDQVRNGPVTLSTRLRPAGSWTLEIRDPDGAVVHSTSGSGSSASVTWSPSTLRVGTYTYAFKAAGRRTASGTITARAEVLDRIGSVTDPVRGAVELSRAAFADDGSANRAVVARDDLFADAMAGGPLAGRSGPLLFTPSGRLDTRVRAELERVLPAGQTVYVLGGEAALSAAVVDGLRDRWQVRRLGGAERTDTAARVAEVVYARRATTTVLVARSGPDDRRPWADALAGGAYGASADIPVLLTASQRLMEPTRRALERYDNVIVLGGTAAISDAVMAEMPVTHKRRIAGADRAGTAAAIARDLWGRSSGTDGDRFVLAGGYRDDAWTMALAGAPLAATRNAPLILANSATLPPETKDYLDRLGYGPDKRAGGWVLGETAAVGSGVVDEVTRLLR